MLVTGVAGTTWTVSRGIEGTTAAHHAAGTAVVAVLTGGALDELRAEIEAEDRTASGIRTASTVVSVSSAAAPLVGQVLTAISSTQASWQGNLPAAMGALQPETFLCAGCTSKNPPRLMC